MLEKSKRITKLEGIVKQLAEHPGTLRVRFEDLPDIEN
jgi:hypothetical protein